MKREEGRGNSFVGSLTVETVYEFDSLTVLTVGRSRGDRSLLTPTPANKSARL